MVRDRGLCVFVKPSDRCLIVPRWKSGEPNKRGLPKQKIYQISLRGSPRIKMTRECTGNFQNAFPTQEKN